MSGHSIIPPSSAGIWGAPEGCTAWPLMQQIYPETDESPEAAEGTASHEIGSTVICDAARGVSNTFKNFEGVTASNGVLYTEDMFDAAEMYANDVIDIMRTTGVFGGPHFGNEQRIEAKRINEQSFGTIDQFMFAKATGDLYVWDYKFGYDVVEAFENWQLINYTAGILERLAVNGIEDQYITVHFRIVQPRAHHRDGPIREWKVNASDLRSYFNILEMNAAEALSEKAVARSGSHCKHCTGRHACEAALKAGVKLYEVATQPMPLELSPEALGVQLAIVKRAAKQIEYLVSGFEEQAKGLIRSGVNVPGWITEQGVGREKWDKPVEEVIAMGDMMGYNLRKPEDVITPIQSKKLGIDEAVISAYSIKPNTEMKIVPDNINRVRQIFGVR